MGCFPFELTHRGTFSPGWCYQPGLKGPLVPGTKNAEANAKLRHRSKVCSLVVTVGNREIRGAIYINPGATRPHVPVTCGWATVRSTLAWPRRQNDAIEAIEVLSSAIEVMSSAIEVKLTLT